MFFWLAPPRRPVGPAFDPVAALPLAVLALSACFAPSAPLNPGGETGQDPVAATTGDPVSPTAPPGAESSDGLDADGSTTGEPAGTTIALDSTTGEGTTGGEETTTGDEVVASSSSGAVDLTRRVFVSSVTLAATAVADGDSVCQGLADDAGLAGEWVAWVSTSDVDARDKLTMGAGPYVLLDGTVIADDEVDLLDGSIDAPIDLDETGTPYEVITAVWTGTEIDGTVGDETCADWSTADNTVTGVRGNVTVTGNGWTQLVSVACLSSVRIYCFEI
jgi:hypothetical protein